MKPEDLEFDLPDRLHKSLRVSGVEVQEMAEFLDVSRATISNWTSGRIKPSIMALRWWAEKTGVPYEWLKTGKYPGD